MDIIRLKETSQFPLKADSWFQESLSLSGANFVFLPAGQTPMALYALWEQKKTKALQGLKLIQIYEIISGQQSGAFKQFFLQNLPTFSSQIEWIGKSATRNTGRGLAMLGLGLNGHIGFHEPHLPIDFSFGEVELSDETCNVLKLEAKTHGISYGLGTFMACERILLMVLGEKKRAILERVLKKEAGLPASQLLNHSNLTILTDLS